MRIIFMVGILCLTEPAFSASCIITSASEVELVTTINISLPNNIPIKSSSLSVKSKDLNKVIDVSKSLNSKSFRGVIPLAKDWVVIYDERYDDELKSCTGKTFDNISENIDWTPSYLSGISLSNYQLTRSLDNALNFINAHLQRKINQTVLIVIKDFNGTLAQYYGDLSYAGDFLKNTNKGEINIIRSRIIQNG